MNITITNKIIIEDAPKEVLKNIKTALTLPNPMYFKMMRMGNVSALYGLKQFFKYYSLLDKKLFIGRGFENKLIKFLKTNHYDYTYKNITTDKKLTEEFKTNIQLRTYQRTDIKVIKPKHTGIIRLGTGYGKTIIAIELIKARQTPTLIIVPRNHLVQQFSETIRENAGLKTGIIQGSKEDIKEITVASIQTLVRRPAILDKIKDYFSMVLVDECHTMITNKRLSVVQMFNAKYIHGLTATPRRTDEQDKAIFFTFGDIIISKDLKRKNPEVKLLKTNVNIPILAGYHQMIDLQVENEERNALITKAIKKELEEKRKILILTKRIAHYQLLASALTDYKIHTINSSDKDSDKSSLLKELREGKQDFDIILGTYSMLSTGTDIPALDTLIFAGDLRSDVLQIQSVGRILRLFKDKQDPKIIDCCDNRNGILFNQAKSRIKTYRELGWLTPNN